MRKWSKGFCNFGVSMAVLGIVLLAVGFLMGGRPQGLSIGWDNGPVLRRQEIAAIGSGGSGTLVTVPPVGAENIRSLSVDIGAARVEIRTGSEFSLDVPSDAKFSSTVEDGMWYLENTNSGVTINLFNTDEQRYILTVPANFSFELVSLSIGAGTVQATGLHAQTATVSVGAGTMILNDFTAQDADIDIGMGTLKLNGALHGYTTLSCGMGTAKLLLDRPANYGYEVKSGMGTVKVDGSSTTGIGNEMAQNPNAGTFYDIDCGMGTVKVEFNGAATSAGDKNTDLEKPLVPEAPQAPKPPEAPEAPAAPQFPAAPAVDNAA